jgi:ribosomal-protein-alanine N-acetyltransferase
MSGIIRLEAAHAKIASLLHRVSFDAPWDEGAFARLLEQPGVAGLAWTAHEPQGFILIRAVADEAEILTLAVVPHARRTGIATHLLDEATHMLYAGGTQRIFLEVAADNAAAIGLYTRYGFKPSGRRPRYYARGVTRMDAIIMTLALAPTTSAPPHH